MIEIKNFFVKEPDLIFAEKNRFKDPKGGLYLFGPYGQYGDASYVNITANAGIIGTSKSISKVTDFFDRLHRKIPATNENSVDFPGLGIKGKLRFDIRFDEQWIETIDRDCVEECENKDGRIEKASYLLDLIDQKLDSLHGKQPSPDIIFISLPTKLLKMCIPPGQIGLKIILANRRFGTELTEEQKKGDYDFHDIIKVMGMKYQIPTQLILPPTLSLKGRMTQDLATRAWNLSVATYYKAKGVPWKLTELEAGTCYTGISFYRECDPDGKQSMRAAVARIFTATGEALILKGDPFECPEYNRQPRLNYEQAVSLREKIITEYKKTHKNPPERIVVYKTSYFTEEEKKGFLETQKNSGKVDLLTLRPSQIDWYREGTYPTVRGNVFKTSNSEFFIFTLGYIPQLKTFPKPGIPIPLKVKIANLDSSEYKMSQEILSLTRLNWNNANFCDLMPITISASRRIGNILSEARARDITIRPEYKYYI